MVFVHKRRLLRNLQIHEVSSVDRGAGEHVNVVLMKRDSGPHLTQYYLDQVAKRQQRENPNMETAPLHNQIRKAAELRETGRISDYDAALVEQDLALKMFPNSPTLSHALNSLYNTEVGKRLQKANVSASYVDLQKRSAVGDGYEAVEKLGGGDLDSPGGGSNRPVADEPDSEHFGRVVQHMASRLGENHPAVRHLKLALADWHMKQKHGITKNFDEHWSKYLRAERAAGRT